LLEVPTSIIHDHGNEKSEISKVETNALIDSGAEGEFIDQNYARKLGIKQMALEEPIKVLNVDGTQNKRGTITHYMELDLQIGERIKRQRLYITGLGKQKIILGFTCSHSSFFIAHRIDGSRDDVDIHSVWVILWLLVVSSVVSWSSCKASSVGLSESIVRRVRLSSCWSVWSIIESLYIVSMNSVEFDSDGVPSFLGNGVVKSVRFLVGI